MIKEQEIQQLKDEYYHEIIKNAKRLNKEMIDFDMGIITLEEFVESFVSISKGVLNSEEYYTRTIDNCQEETKD